MNFTELSFRDKEVFGGLMRDEGEMGDKMTGITNTSLSHTKYIHIMHFEVFNPSGKRPNLHFKNEKNLN